MMITLMGYSMLPLNGTNLQQNSYTPYNYLTFISVFCWCGDDAVAAVYIFVVLSYLLEIICFAIISNFCFRGEYHIVLARMMIHEYASV